jgi:hypothetical protein
MENPVRDMLIALRRGGQDYCDYCGAVVGEDNIHPDEGGTWSCTKCLNEALDYADSLRDQFYEQNIVGECQHCGEEGELFLDETGRMSCSKCHDEALAELRAKYQAIDEFRVK